MYIHEVTKSFDKNLQVNEILIDKKKIDYKNYIVFNIKTGKERKLCELKYLGRVRTDLSNEDTWKEIGDLQKKGAVIK